MSQEIKKNKVDDATKRRAEHIEDRLEKKGMGRDEAEKRALAEAVEERPAPGGSNQGGEAKKGSTEARSGRTGSDSNAS